MPAIDTNDFDARLDSLECSEAIREIVAYLRNAAEQAGADVSSRAYSTPGGGWGITPRIRETTQKGVFERQPGPPTGLSVRGFRAFRG